MLQLLCPRVPRNRVSDAPADDVALEEVMDRLQRHVLRLGHAEDRVDAHEYAARPKEQECAICNVAQHDRGEFSNHLSQRQQIQSSKANNKLTKLKSHWVISAAAMTRERTTPRQSSAIAPDERALPDLP